MLISLALMVGSIQEYRVPTSDPIVAVADRCTGDFPTLAQALVRDLPSYGNRALLRDRRRFPNQSPPSIITTGEPDLNPLPLPTSESLPEGARQLFVTTLERTYTSDRVVDEEVYRWIVLAQTENGWIFVRMLSRYGSEYNPSYRRIETIDMAIATAIRTWLRDCQATDRQ
ncbi:hypothetical protein [Roseofilum casamattae]|uniref:Uncharacterized protein n=1 Tax=Roseofilum casamattae BLCC-M143 TaxID=3022442 RepID=A0ABT7BRT0_9CYAN|nr:hypothetical protein [Roseofilum casamattae]MDJ1181899.1 hypothetical protein [Roseofilum casamattae BLCC-M143]